MGQSNYVARFLATSCEFAASGDLVGIVSTEDLLGIIAEQLGSLASLVDRQTRRRGR